MRQRKTIPWYAYLIVYRPRRVLSNLARFRQPALAARAPNLWQVCAGVMRMWHRLIFRLEPDPDASDPDISFLAYLDWCASQPPTLGQSWRAWRQSRC